MFGHGERGCYVRPNCGNCAGKHKTSDCIVPDRVKCANCNDNHKSNDIACPNRAAYLRIKEKYNRQSTRPSLSPSSPNMHTQPNLDFGLTQFPPLPSNRTNNVDNTRAVESGKVLTWRSPIARTAEPMCGSSNLFTEREITELTFELIQKLKECRSKHDQFNAIAQLAIKFLYSSNK